MIFEPLESVTILHRGGKSTTIKAPTGCHLRLTDAAWGRPKRDGDVIRVEEIEDGAVNVGADYFPCGYEVRGKKST